MFIEMLETELNEAFSEDMKKSMSRHILGSIARRLKDLGISAQNVTFKKLPKDQQAKLKRRVKDAEGVGRFVIICHNQDLKAVDELVKLKKAAKEHTFNLKAEGNKEKIDDLIKRARGICYFIDTRYSDCTEIVDKYEYDWDYFDDDGKKTYTYTGNNKILTSVKGQIRTGKWEGYVAEIQNMMRDLDHDAYVLVDEDGNADITGLEDSRRKSRYNDDPLEPDGYYERKSPLYKQHQEEAQKSKNKKAVKDDAKMLIDLINEFDDVRNLFIKTVNAVTVNNKKGASDYYYQAEHLISKLEKLKDVVHSFRWYADDYWNRDTDIHSKILNKIKDIK